VDGQDGVPEVVSLVEQGPELAVGQAFFEAGQSGLDLGADVLALREEFRQDVDLVLLFLDLSEELEVVLEPLFFLLEGLGGLLVLPDLRRSEALVNRFAFGFFMIEVKESPAALRICRRSCRGAS
jgi:hypothetical protein